jgi:hypothetical protein
VKRLKVTLETYASVRGRLDLQRLAFAILVPLEVVSLVAGLVRCVVVVVVVVLFVVVVVRFCFFLSFFQ